MKKSHPQDEDILGWILISGQFTIFV